MHLIIPYAASQAFTGPEACAGLPLPHLQALLGQLQPQALLRDSPASWHLPHERLLAQSLGWDPAAPTLPWAAWHQALQGHDSPQAQSWMTPCHWQIGIGQVVMADPDHLHLSDTESQQLLLAMQPFLQEDGLQATWHSALRWHIQGALLTGLATASLDRVIGQNVQLWTSEQAAARPLQRLQSEMQMLLYNHPVNDARESRRQHTVNAFWLHGAGVLAASSPVARQSAHMPDSLRSSALQADVAAWRQAWQALDNTAVADALQHLQTGGQVTLSLCSELRAQSYTNKPATWHQRISRLFNTTSPAAALQALISD
ncbi:hypothetical protein [Limnohabitans sp.]|jgi:hypothetical protein|uniref:hypothetical protein n=1 Tax=Limnohabitans sp. TaxID=1907725 RepID=UPI0037BFAE83